MFHKKAKRAKELAEQVAPLLRDLFPGKTDEERATVLTLFSVAHDGQSIESLDDFHISKLQQTLEYHVQLQRSTHAFQRGDFELGPGSPAIADECSGCQEFKASMFELQTGLRFKRDQEERLVIPISLEDSSSSEG